MNRYLYTLLDLWPRYLFPVQPIVKMLCGITVAHVLVIVIPWQSSSLLWVVAGASAPR